MFLFDKRVRICVKTLNRSPHSDPSGLFVYLTNAQSAGRLENLCSFVIIRYKCIFDPFNQKSYMPIIKSSSGKKNVDTERFLMLKSTGFPYFLGNVIRGFLAYVT